MTQRYQPRRQLSIFIRFTQILFQPIELIGNGFKTIIQEIVKFGGESNKMYWTNVKTVEKAFGIAWHIKASAIIWKITENKIKNAFCANKNDNFVHVHI